MNALTDPQIAIANVKGTLSTSRSSAHTMKKSKGRENMSMSENLTVTSEGIIKA